MRGLHLGTSRVKSQMMPTCPNPVPRTSSQFLQEFSSYFGLIPHKLLHLRRSQVPASIGGSLEECLANKFQAYRLRVTHLKMNKRIGSKDESKQRRECKAEFPALSVAAAALPCKCTLDKKYTEKKVCSLSILSPTDSSSPSSTTSRGSTTPRSPTSTTPTSTAT